MLYSHSHNDINHNSNTIHTHLQMQNTGGLCYSGTNSLLTSDFSSSTRGERHKSYYATHRQRGAHLVMFKISVGRDPKNTTTSSTVKIQL